MEITEERMNELSRYAGSIHLHRYADETDVVVRIKFGTRDAGAIAGESLYNRLLEMEG